MILALRVEVSVVIATLGAESLRDALALLFSGTRVPDEVLVCIPEQVVLEDYFSDMPCVRILRTPCRGQVSQRAYGLSRARNCYVLQMDDDVFLGPSALSELFSLCQQAGNAAAISPLLRDSETGDYLTSYRSDFRGSVKSLVATVVCGAPWGWRRMGKIDQAGIPYAVDRSCCGVDELVETEWLPGGCVICHKDALVTDEYYPFPGKAYSEDVIHSLVWRSRGIRLLVAPNIECCTRVVAMPATLAGIRADYRARAYVVALNGGSLLRCKLWFALFISRLWLSRLLGMR